MSCEQCNGFSGRSYCPVCSKEVHITLSNELIIDDVISVTMVRGEVSEATVWLDGKEAVIDVDDLSVELKDRLIEENEEE